MNKTLFDFDNYKEYLAFRFSTTGDSRGLRSKLASMLKCQTSFISQVINGKTHFSLEHAIRINEFLKHNEDETHYFMLLVHAGRAGSKTLESYYSDQISQIQKKRQLVRERIQVRQGISKDDQARYYSAWYFPAIHILLSVPGFGSKTTIAEHLKLPMQTVADCLDFLVLTGLAVSDGDTFRIGTARIHLDSDSPLISKHHTNWRMRAINSFDVPARNDLHYSSVISLSEGDALQMRSLFLKALEASEPILKASKEEAVFSLCMDLFRV